MPTKQSYVWCRTLMCGAMLLPSLAFAQSYFNAPLYPPQVPPVNTGVAPAPMQGFMPMGPGPRDRFGGWERAWERWNHQMFGDTFANMFGDMGVDFEVDASVKAQGQMDAQGVTQGRGAAQADPRANALRYYGQPSGGWMPPIANPYGWR